MSDSKTTPAAFKFLNDIVLVCSDEVMIQYILYDIVYLFHTILKTEVLRAYFCLKTMLKHNVLTKITALLV